MILYPFHRLFRWKSIRYSSIFEQPFYCGIEALNFYLNHLWVWPFEYATGTGKSNCLASNYTNLPSSARMREETHHFSSVRLPPLYDCLVVISFSPLTILPFHLSLKHQHWHSIHSFVWPNPQKRPRTIATHCFGCPMESCVDLKKYLRWSKPLYWVLPWKSYEASVRKIHIFWSKR